MRAHLLLLSLLLLVVAMPAHESDARRPAVTQHVVGRGQGWETSYTVRVGPAEGPTVMIVGGAHGNEPAGAVAADQIRHWELAAGRLVVIPRVNVRALAAANRFTPGVPRELKNLNRNYPDATAEAGDEGRRPRGEVAEAVWRLVERFKPDWLLDLHEGFAPHRINPKSCGNSVVAYAEHSESVRMADLLIAAVNATMTQKERRFLRLRQVTRTTLARSAGDSLGIPTLILETCFTKQPLPRRARRHRLMVHRCLTELGMLARGVRVEDVLPVQARRRGNTAVALYDAEGSAGRGIPSVLAQLGTEERVHVVRVCPADIRGNVLEPFDVVIFTGGSAGGQARALGVSGREHVQAFVRGGGGYIGICAGAYLATSGSSSYLRLLDARTVSPKWRRGRAVVEAEWESAGRSAFRARKRRFKVLYNNGPIIQPLGLEDLPDYEVLAVYRTETARNGTPKGVMVGSPAVAQGRCGKGRVLIASPHPEQTGGMEDFVPRAVEIVRRR